MTRPRSAAAVACAALLVLAGCGAVTSGDGGTPTTTLTPVEVPDDAIGDLAPGIGERRVTDRETVASVHRSVLTASSYRLDYRQVVEGPNGTLSTIQWNATAVPERRAYTVSRSQRSARLYVGTGPDARIDLWFHDGVVRNRFIPADRQPRYWGYDEAVGAGRLRAPTRTAETVATLAAFEYRIVDRRTVDGTRLYTLRSTGLADPSLLDVPFVLDRPRNATLRAVVSETGVVRSYDLRYDARHRESHVRVRTSYAVSGVGTTTLPRPAWLTTANESVTGRGDQP